MLFRRLVPMAIAAFGTLLALGASATSSGAPSTLAEAKSAAEAKNSLVLVKFSAEW